MALVLKDNNIEIYIPNSEASIKAQHIGIKDRTVGSYYVSEFDDLVEKYLNKYEGHFYIDLFRTYINMGNLYDYIIKNEKSDLFKDNLMNQLMICGELEKNNLYKSYYEIPSPKLTETRKYLKFDRNNKMVCYFADMLLGDITKIVFIKNNNDYIIYGDVVEDYKDKIDKSFK